MKPKKFRTKNFFVGPIGIAFNLITFIVIWRTRLYDSLLLQREMFYQAILFAIVALWWPINSLTDDYSPERALLASPMGVVEAIKALVATAWILR